MISCKSEDQARMENITKAVNALKSNDDKKEYLEAIFEKHIDNRMSETQAWNTYGRNSDEYIELKSNNRADDLVLADKISAYLNTYGYPSIMKVGQKSAVIPIAHITYLDDKDLLEKNFNYFYDAFVFNDITEDLFFEYLINLLDVSWDERRTMFREYNQTEIVEILLEKAKKNNY